MAVPKYLSCPEIARRSGYSRMQITRLARRNEIPSERMVTPGGHIRYEMTDELAEWIRVMRGRPQFTHRLRSGAYVFGRRVERLPRKRDGAIIVEEITGFLEEIESRVTELLSRDPVATKEEVGQLVDTLKPVIFHLMMTDSHLCNLLNNGFFDLVDLESPGNGKI